MKYKIYLFDFDGTIADSKEAMFYIFSSSFNKVGIKIKESDVFYLMRHPLEDAYYKFNGPKDKVDIFKSEIVRTLLSDESVRLTTLYPETELVITELRSRGAKIGLVTSNDIKHCFDVFDNLNFNKELIDVFIGRNECSNHKPHPEPIIKALDSLYFDYKRHSNEVVYIGDSLLDIEAGKNSGINYLLLDRYNEYNDLECPVIHDLKELLN